MEYSEKIDRLNADIKKAEARLKRIREFAKRGGEHRLILTADVDCDTRNDVQDLADRHLPARLIMQTLERAAVKELREARARLVLMAGD